MNIGLIEMGAKSIKVSLFCWFESSLSTGLNSFQCMDSEFQKLSDLRERSIKVTPLKDMDMQIIE